MQIELLTRSAGERLQVPSSFIEGGSASSRRWMKGTSSDDDDKNPQWSLHRNSRTEEVDG